MIKMAGIWKRKCLEQTVAVLRNCGKERKLDG